MNRLFAPLLLILLAAGVACAAQETAVTAARINLLPKQQQPAWQSYLDRSIRQMKIDRDAIAAEVRTQGLKDSVAPADATDFKFDSKKADDWFTTPEASRIADNIVSFQTPSGGWSKHVSMTKGRRQPGERFAGGNGWHYVGTFDNDATIAQLRFLARVVRITGNAACRESFLRGLDYIFMAQYPNGGWPQIFPLEGSYHDQVTFNDGAVVNILKLLRDISDNQTDFSFVPAEIRSQSASSVDRGIACILECQIMANGRRTAWCQQHDALTLKPGAARAFEMISQSGSESAGIAQFLMEIPTPNVRTVTGVHSVCAWLKKVAIPDHEWKTIDGDRQFAKREGAPRLWARYYEIGSDRPLFGDRDSSIHYDVREISKERRNGYSWYNTSPEAALQKYDAWSKKNPPPPENK